MAVAAAPASAAPAAPAAPVAAQAVSGEDANALACRSATSVYSDKGKRGSVYAKICWNSKSFTVRGTIKDHAPRDRFVRVGVHVRYNNRVHKSGYPFWLNQKQASTKSWSLSSKGYGFRFRVCVKDSWSRMWCGAWK
ncbi:hypothetical protein GCM10010411_23060 [Actinomadura fulvescens]|uniref:Secreted protein n=2 Tax=Actinomadura fulvescens TaxID=46160 RepID=A0ABN3PMF2_9ACTN